MYFVKLFKVIAFNCFTVVMLFSSCRAQEKEVVEDPANYEYFVDWSIDMDYLEAGCNGGYDCIKSLENPVFIGVKDVDYINDEDLVVGLKIGDEVRCYPHAILDWHEIVNDNIDDIYFSINYCPLTGSGMAWDRRVDGKLTQFGVSGLLFNSNVIPYDRATGSHWSQMQQKCVNGEFYKQRVKSYPVIETTWKTWKEMYPKSKVVSTETGFKRDYGNYPYYSYKENEDVFFPTEYDNDTIHPKVRYYGVIDNDKAHLYSYNLFKDGTGLIKDTVWDKPVVVAGSEPDQVMMVVASTVEGLKLSTKELPSILEDSSGNTYDIFGYCINGPDKGSRLEVLNGFTAYWFAWAAFYPELSLYKP